MPIADMSGQWPQYGIELKKRKCHRDVNNLSHLCLVSKVWWFLHAMPEPALIAVLSAFQKENLIVGDVAHNRQRRLHPVR